MCHTVILVGVRYGALRQPGCFGSWVGRGERGALEGVRSTQNCSNPHKMSDLLIKFCMCQC